MAEFATQKDVDSLKEQVKKLGGAMKSASTFGQGRYDKEGRLVSYTESEPLVGVQKGRVTGYNQPRHSLNERPRKLWTAPKGYQPHEDWNPNAGKSAGNFYYQCATDPNFEAKILETFKAVQGMQEAVLSDGGAFVLPEFSTKILEHVWDNDLWSMTDNYTVGGNTMVFPRLDETSRVNGSRAGGVLGYWPDEGLTLTASQPKPGQFQLRLKKVNVLIYLTDELLEDGKGSGFALEQYIERKSAEELNFQLGDAVVRGDGTFRPLGIMNSPARVTIAKQGGQLVNTILYQNVNNMWSRMMPQYLSQSFWLVNTDTYPQLELMSIPVGTGGAPVYVPPGGASEAPFGTIKGRPVIPVEFCSTLGTVGDIILWAPQNYVTISKGGVQQAVSMHVEFLTHQTALRFTMRVDGAPWEDSPITPYQGNNTLSSIVELATRA